MSPRALLLRVSGALVQYVLHWHPVAQAYKHQLAAAWFGDPFAHGAASYAQWREARLQERVEYADALARAVLHNIHDLDDVTVPDVRPAAVHYKPHLRLWWSQLKGYLHAAYSDTARSEVFRMRLAAQPAAHRRVLAALREGQRSLVEHAKVPEAVFWQAAEDGHRISIHPTHQLVSWLSQGERS